MTDANIVLDVCMTSDWYGHTYMRERSANHDLHTSHDNNNNNNNYTDIIDYDIQQTIQLLLLAIEQHFHKKNIDEFVFDSLGESDK